MNISFFQNNLNEWTITNENGKLRFIKTSDATNDEIKAILLKEDELENLMNEKNSLMQKIAKINKDDITAKKENRLFLIFIAITVIIFFGLLFYNGLNFANLFCTLVISLLGPASISAMCKLVIIDKYGTKKSRKKAKTDYEEKLAKLIEKEPELVKEIYLLKGKYHLEEETKNVTYIPDLKENLEKVEQREAKRVRKRRVK